MTPRLSSSKSWTDLPAEFTAKVQTVFLNQFKHEAAQGEFLIEGRIYPEEIVLRAGYLEKGRLKQINFEASMDRPKAQPTDDSSEQTSTMDRLYICIDVLGSLMEEYFEMDAEDEIDLPLRWRAYDFDNETVYLQHSTENTRLEEEADRLLGVSDKTLIHEEAPSEDALANAEIDTELAQEIQKLIRAGKYPKTTDSDDESGSDEPVLN